MKYFVLFLALRLVSSDKLDRTYLPPPGSKYAGGSEGAIDVPLEFPKESYSTTARPFQGQTLGPDDTQPTLGINRGLGFTITQATQRPFNDLQNKYTVPTTTTSYAFTQTTTFPLTEGFETTLSPTGVPGFDEQQVFGSDEGIYPQNIQGHQGFSAQTSSQKGLTTRPFSQRPGITNEGQQIVTDRPGSQTQFIPPGYLPTGQQTGSLEGNIQQPEISQSQVPGQLGSQLRPGYPNIPDFQTTPGSLIQQLGQKQRPDRPQLGYRPGPGISEINNQSSDFGLQSSVPIGSAFGGPQGYSQPQYQNTTLNQQQYSTNVPGIPLPGSKTLPGSTQTTQGQQQNQYTGVQPPINQQGFLQSTVSPQGFYQQTSNAQGYPILEQSVDGQRPFIPSTATTPTGTYQPERGQYDTSFGNIQDNIQLGLAKPSQLPGSQLFPSTTSPRGFSGTQTIFPQYSSDNMQGTFLESQQLGYQTPTQVTQGSEVTFPSSTYGPSYDQSYQQKPFPDGKIPPSRTRPQVGQNQDQSSDERFSQQFGTTPRPGIAGSTQNVYLPQTTASAISTSYPGQSFLSTTPASSMYGTTPSSNYSPSKTFTQESIRPSLANLRPERPQAESDRNAVIINYENVLTPEGYAYSYDTSNGIHADESGTAIGGVRAQGSYSYIGDDGKEYSIIYSADENGFLPRGDHLPTPPPIPEAIKRVIEQAEKDKEAGIYHDGSYDEAKYGHNKYQRPKNRYPSRKQENALINGVDIPDHFYDGKENLMPQSPGSQRPNFNQDVGEKSHSYGTKKLDSKTKKPMKSFLKPSSESFMENEYEERDSAIDELGNVESIENKPQFENQDRYKPVNQGITSKKPQLAGFTPDSSSNEFTNTLNNKNNQYDEEIGTENDKLRPGLVKLKPGMDLSQYLPKEQTQKNQKDQILRPRPGVTQSYSEVSDREPGSSLGGNDFKEFNMQTLIGKPIGSQRPSSSTNAYGEVYETQTNDEFLRQGEKQKGPERPGSSANAYSEFYGIEKPDEPSLLEEEYNEDKTAQGVLKLPGNRRPSSQTIFGDQFYTTQKPEKPGTGYQYIPPQNKFVEDEITGFSTRFPEIKVTTSKPQTYDTPKKTQTAKPFMTPNVSRDEDVSYDDYDSTSSSKTPGKFAYGTMKLPASVDENNEYPKILSDYNNKINTTDQNIDEESVTPSRVRPSRPGATLISPTKRPTYQTQLITGRPEFEDISTTSDQGVRKQTGQSNRNQYTTGMNPEDEFKQKFGQRVGGPRKPEMKFSSTTVKPAMPTQKPTQFVIKPEGFSQTNQEKSTYEPEDAFGTMQPGSFEEETVTISQRPGSKLPTKKPISRPGGRPVSSTSRPGISVYETDKSVTSDDSTALEPGMIRSGFSQAPFITTTLSSVDDFTNTLRPDLSTRRPSYDRIGSTSRSENKTPERSGTRFQNIPSTTFRPIYSLPEKQQPSQIDVDGFGRPILTGSNKQYSTSTFRPDYTIPSSTTPRLPYQDRTNIGQISQYNDTFYPDEPRFGHTEEQTKESFTENDRFGPDQSQEVFRPQNQVPFNSFGSQNQGSVRPPNRYELGQSTTEKIIGEDFSGPKQPQRFDPKYGYYY